MARKVVYSMSQSLDGFIADANGEIDWSVPDDELHRFHNDRVRDVGVQLCGRRLYETMLYWETAEADPELSATEREFAEIWRPLPKVVFSNTLDAVEGNYRLATASLADELTALKDEPGKDIEIGGATLAGQAIELGLVDEFCIFTCPVILGAGTPFFPAELKERVALELVETRTFPTQVVYTRYRLATGRSSSDS